MIIPAAPIALTTDKVNTTNNANISTKIINNTTLTISFHNITRKLRVKKREALDELPIQNLCYFRDSLNNQKNFRYRS